jgi:hypothetical protein
MGDVLGYRDLVRCFLCALLPFAWSCSMAHDGTPGDGPSPDDSGLVDDTGSHDDTGSDDDTGSLDDTGIGVWPPPLLRDGFGSQLTVFRACNDLFFSAANAAATLAVHFTFLDSPLEQAESAGGTKAITYTLQPTKDLVYGEVRIGEHAADCDCQCEDEYDDIVYYAYEGTLIVTPDVPATGDPHVTLEIMDDVLTGGWHGGSAKPGHKLIENIEVTTYP